MAHCPDEQDSIKHALHLLTGEDTQVWLGSVNVNFDLFEVLFLELRQTEMLVFGLCFAGTVTDQIRD